MREWPAVTVVVPTKDRPVPLARCLAALAAQDLEDVQIVVVDDASRDDRAVARVVAATPGARLLRVRGQGPAAARNLGAQTAAAPLVLFTDDDCRPDSGWASALRHELDAGAQVAAGPVRHPVVGGPCGAAAQTITNYLTEWSLVQTTAGFVSTCNVGMRTEVARAFPFDEAFPLAVGGDREWCARLRQAGVGIRWVPEAVLEHHPDLPWKVFWSQQVQYGRCARRYEIRRADGVRPQRMAVRRAERHMGFEQGVRVGGLVIVAQAAHAVGRFRQFRT